MQFALTQEQQLLKDTIEKFVRDRYAEPAQRSHYRANSRGFSAENWRDLADIGLFGLLFSTQDGGLGGGPRELVTALEALGAGLTLEPVLEEIVIAGGVLARAGESAGRALWLPRLLAGESHLTLAHFEHGGRFNLSDVRVRARPTADGVVLEGEKAVVPLAGTADVWIVSAREQGDTTDPEGIAFYLVSPTAAGIERRDFNLTDGSLASAIRFRDVPAAERLKLRFAEFAAAIDLARLAAGAEMVGIMSSLFQATLDYLRTRQQFGVPLSSFQALQHRMADLFVRLEQSRSQLYRAAACASNNLRRERSIAGMKSYISRAAVELGEECVHLHGGIGTTDELAIGHGYKRLLWLASLFGDTNAELMRFIRLAS